MTKDDMTGISNNDTAGEEGLIISNFEDCECIAQMDYKVAFGQKGRTSGKLHYGASMDALDTPHLL